MQARKQPRIPDRQAADREQGPPTACLKGFPWRQSFSTKMTTASAAMTATFITPTATSTIIRPQQHPAHVAP